MAPEAAVPGKMGAAAAAAATIAVRVTNPI
jgi:hypothetical protein